MFTAMYQFKDQYGTLYTRNAKIGGYKRYSSAIQAIKRKSPIQSGWIQMGQDLVSIVVKGRETKRDFTTISL